MQKQQKTAKADWRLTRHLRYTDVRSRTLHSFRSSRWNLRKQQKSHDALLKNISLEWRIYWASCKGANGNWTYCSLQIVIRVPGRSHRCCVDYGSPTRITKGDSYPYRHLRTFSGILLASSCTVVLISKQNSGRSKFVKKTNTRQLSLASWNYLNARLCHLDWRMAGLFSKDSLTSWVIHKLISDESLDVLTIGAHAFGEMIELLTKLFTICRYVKLKLYPDKCKLFIKEIRVLGHVLQKKEFIQWTRF